MFLKLVVPLDDNCSCDSTDLSIIPASSNQTSNGKEISSPLLLRSHVLDFPDSTRSVLATFDMHGGEIHESGKELADSDLRDSPKKPR